MKKFIVLSLAVSGLGNKIFRHGDKVTEANFPQGNADALVSSGHLKELKQATPKPELNLDELDAKFTETEIDVLGDTFTRDENLALVKLYKLKVVNKKDKTLKAALVDFKVSENEAKAAENEAKQAAENAANAAENTATDNTANGE